MPKLSDRRPYTITRGLLEWEFEFEGKMLPFKKIIIRLGGFTNAVTWAFEGRFPGFTEVKHELDISNRRKAAMGNTRGKGRKHPKVQSDEIGT